MIKIEEVFHIKHKGYVIGLIDTEPNPVIGNVLVSATSKWKVIEIEKIHGGCFGGCGSGGHKHQLLLLLQFISGIEKPERGVELSIE